MEPFTCICLRLLLITFILTHHLYPSSACTSNILQAIIEIVRHDQHITLNKDILKREYIYSWFSHKVVTIKDCTTSGILKYDTNQWMEIKSIFHAFYSISIYISVSSKLMRHAHDSCGGIVNYVVPSVVWVHEYDCARILSILCLCLRFWGGKRYAYKL